MKAVENENLRFELLIVGGRKRLLERFGIELVGSADAFPPQDVQVPYGGEHRQHIEQHVREEGRDLVDTNAVIQSMMLQDRNLHEHDEYRECIQYRNVPWCWLAEEHSCIHRRR